MRMRWCIVLMMLLLSVCTVGAQEGTFTNAGLTLHYRTLGKGSPVVLLSGGPGMDVDYMQPLAEIVAHEHTAILLEQRGTGRSMPATFTKETLNGELLLSDLEALRTKLGYAQWVVLGHSAGSLTAEFYAIAHPSAVRALVLTGALPPALAEFGHANDNMMARLTPEEKARMAQTGPGATPDQMMAVLRDVFAADFYDGDKGRAFAQTMTVQNFHANTMGVLESSMTNFDLRTDLAKLRIPTLIVQGRQDPYDLQMAGETRDAIPGARMVIVERAGHFGWIEQPDAYSKAISDFLHDK